MGCSSSKEVTTTRPARPSQGTNISRPVHPPGPVPAPARDGQGVPLHYQQHDLSAQDLHTALGYAAKYLHNRNQNALIITVGGAVNTLFLQSRRTTHDVDFFSQQLSGQPLEVLRAAGLYAAERSSVPLSVDWLNNATARMPGVVENVAQLISDAKEQNAIVFRASGLTALAAPWNYAFVKKVSRISQGVGRAYDAQDAVGYLHQHILRKGGRPVNVNLIRQWGDRYRANVPNLILDDINQKYHSAHGNHGIDFSSNVKPQGRGNTTARRRRWENRSLRGGTYSFRVPGVEAFLGYGIGGDGFGRCNSVVGLSGSDFFDGICWDLVGEW